MPKTSELVRDRTGIDLVRFAPAAPRLRAEPEDPPAGEESEAGAGTLFGHFSVFDSWYEIDSYWEGNFIESVAPGAFAKTFADDVQRCWFEHGYSSVLGSMTLGTNERLEEDDIGAAYEVALFDGLPTVLLAGLRAGVYGASFRFRIMEQTIDEEPGVSDHNPKGLPEVRLLRLQVPEFGPVSIGASPAATANLRSTDRFYEAMRSHDPSRWADAARRAGIGAPDDLPVGASTVGAAGGEQATPNTSRAMDMALRLPKEHTTS